MRLRIQTHLDYRFARPADILVQIAAAALPDQQLEHATLHLAQGDPVRRVAGHDGIGERILTAVGDRLIADYDAIVTIERAPARLPVLPATPPRDVPGAVVEYLMPSRYCPSDLFEAFAEDRFGGLAGGACAVAIDAHVRAAIVYQEGASHGATTAADTLAAGRGVCRDFAHVVVTLARASGIPARVASGYGSRVDPPDFHLVAQLYLGGGWHIVDATGMSHGDDFAIIGVGRDAADVAFLTSWGDATFGAQSVRVTPLS